jgi:mannitol-1-phosphate 5-dehydrogenase
MMVKIWILLFQECQINMKRKKLVHFGAGNIGRSFIGQLFSQIGYEVVFIDVNKELIKFLNERNQYKVIIKNSDLPDETILVENVRAIDGTDIRQVTDEIATASYLSSSVGKDALPKILPSVAKGLVKRRRNSGLPLDFIIAENVRNSPDLIREQLRKYLPEGFNIDGFVSIVETSIGKMVPIMKETDYKTDPLQVFAEKYNTLILDKKAFLNTVPDLPGLMAVDNIRAYIDRKSFIHNLGHAALSYLGYQYNPDITYVWEALEIPMIKSDTYNAMHEAAWALIAEYPNEFTIDKLEEYINDLLARFRNKSLEDTIYRVGRDLRRKLAHDDRLVGAIHLAKKHDLPYYHISKVVKAAFLFYAKNEKGLVFPSDIEYREEMLENLFNRLLKE